jgi:hypothetical protein
MTKSNLDVEVDIIKPLDDYETSQAAARAAAQWARMYGFSDSNGPALAIELYKRIQELQQSEEGNAPFTYPKVMVVKHSGQDVRAIPGNERIIVNPIDAVAGNFIITLGHRNGKEILSIDLRLLTD